MVVSSAARHPVEAPSRVLAWVRSWQVLVRRSSVRSRAAILAEHGQPLVVDELTYPAPGPDQVFVKLYASGICHSQLHQIHNANQPRPALLGHEATGVVEAKGANVTHVKEGDRVFMTWVPRLPRDGAPPAPPVSLQWRDKEILNRGVYTWAEHVLCDSSCAVKAPDDVDVN